MTNIEAIQIIERILDPDPWEYINWSDKAKEALVMAIDALKKPSEAPTCCGYDLKELIAFGQICRRYGIKDSDLKDFIMNSSLIWQVMQKEFESHIDESI